jgi:hypothetical protein
MPKKTQAASTQLLNALEAFANLEASGIDPRLAEVSLPLSEWRHVAQKLEAERSCPLPGRHRAHRSRGRGLFDQIRRQAMGLRLRRDFVPGELDLSAQRLSALRQFRRNDLGGCSNRGPISEATSRRRA